MSVAHYSWAWGVEGLTSTEKFVLIALCEFADAKTNACWPSQDLIATRTNFERRSIGRALAKLEARALIARSSRHGAHGYRTSDRIVLCVGATGDADTTQRDRQPRDRGTAPTSLSRRSQAIVDAASCGGESQREEPTMNPLVIPSLNPGPTADGFEEFWQVYPKRRDQGRARAAWVVALGRADAGELIEGARRYADERRFQEDRFTKSPANWLEASAWLDEPADTRSQLTDTNHKTFQLLSQLRGEEHARERGTDEVRGWGAPRAIGSGVPARDRSADDRVVA